MIRHLQRQQVCFAVVDAASAQAEYPATKCIFLTCEKSKCDGVCGAGHLANGWGFISFLPYAVVVIIAHWSVQSRRRVLCRRDFSDIFVLRPAHSIFHFGMFAQIIFTFGCVFAIKVLHVSIRAKNTKTCNKFANGFNFTTTTANVSMAHSVKMSHSMCSPFSTSSNFFSILYLKCASLPHLCVQAERVCYAMKGKWVLPMKSHSKLEATSAEFSFDTLRKHCWNLSALFMIFIYLFSLLFSSHPLHPHLHIYFGEHPICTCRRSRQKSSTGIISRISFVAHRDSLYQTQTHLHIHAQTHSQVHTRPVPYDVNHKKVRLGEADGVLGKHKAKTMGRECGRARAIWCFLCVLAFPVELFAFQIKNSEQCGDGSASGKKIILWLNSISSASTDNAFAAWHGTATTTSGASFFGECVSHRCGKRAHIHST